MLKVTKLPCRVCLNPPNTTDFGGKARRLQIFTPESIHRPEFLLGKKVKAGVRDSGPAHWTGQTLPGARALTPPAPAPQHTHTHGGGKGAGRN